MAASITFRRSARERSSTLIPGIAFLVFTFVIPVIQVIQLSFTNYNTITGAMRGVGFANYAYLLTGSTSEYFYPALGHTVLYAVVRLSFDVTIALLIAVMLDSNVRSRNSCARRTLRPWSFRLWRRV